MENAKKEILEEVGDREMNYLGYLMAIAPFAFLFYLICRIGGVSAAFGVFGVCGFIVGWIYIACELMKQTT
jgi:hypothetical protein